jgi:hypothetical protein
MASELIIKRATEHILRVVPFIFPMLFCWRSWRDIILQKPRGGSFQSRCVVISGPVITTCASEGRRMSVAICQTMAFMIRPRQRFSSPFCSRTAREIQNSQGLLPWHANAKLRGENSASPLWKYGIFGNLPKLLTSRWAYIYGIFIAGCEKALYTLKLICRFT